MKRKLLSMLMITMIFTFTISFYATAEVTQPTTLSAPEHFAAGHYYGDYIYFTLSAPEDLRDYIGRLADDDPVNRKKYSAHSQFDYKIDDGSWHYTKDWDSPTIKHKNTLYAQMVNGQSYITTYERESLSNIFPEDPELKVFAEAGWDYFSNHSITFRARFVESFDSGKTNVISDWSNEYTLSANLKEDTDKMINHAPTLLSADIKIAGNGEPYFEVKSDRIPGEIMDLYSISNGSVRTEIWMRRLEDKEFKLIKQDSGSLELFKILAGDYFKDIEQRYDEQSYEIKMRYVLDLRSYKQAGIKSTTSVNIFSPYSNIFSHNMPAWSNASEWATVEVKKALDNGLYPDKLKDADLTKPITRAEFAAVALKLYESLAGKTSAPAPTSTFTDTKDTDVLKAYALDIIVGVGNNKFAPDELLSREQAATMLTRVYKKVNWEGWKLAEDNSYTKHSLDNKGVPPFDDDTLISDYARDSVYFMTKYGIIKGIGNNKFAPRNTTSAEVAAGYANSTREQALAISNRTFEKVDEIQDGGQTSTTSPTQTDHSLVIGSWVLGNLSGGAFNAVTGKYEGGATGLGQIYTFKADGTYTGLVIWSNVMCFTGKYSITDGVITLTDRVVEESSDDGRSWGVKENLPDTSTYFTVGTDGTEKYLLLGEEGAELPLVDKKNALKYNFLSDIS